MIDGRSLRCFRKKPGTFWDGWEGQSLFRKNKQPRKNALLPEAVSSKGCENESNDASDKNANRDVRPKARKSRVEIKTDLKIARFLSKAVTRSCKKFKTGQATGIFRASRQKQTPRQRSLYSAACVLSTKPRPSRALPAFVNIVKNVVFRMASCLRKHCVGRRKTFDFSAKTFPMQGPVPSASLRTAIDVCKQRPLIGTGYAIS